MSESIGEVNRAGSPLVKKPNSLAWHLWGCLLLLFESTYDNLTINVGTVGYMGHVLFPILAKLLVRCPFAAYRVVSLVPLARDSPFYCFLLPCIWPLRWIALPPSTSSVSTVRFAVFIVTKHWNPVAIYCPCDSTKPIDTCPFCSEPFKKHISF